MAQYKTHRITVTAPSDLSWRIRNDSESEGRSGWRADRVEEGSDGKTAYIYYTKD